MLKRRLTVLWVVLTCGSAWAEVPLPLRVGRAGHAFEHVGAINDQAQAAAASGATIIYPAGLGAEGYEGLPPLNVLAARIEAVREYNRFAKSQGIELSIGYICATSIVRLPTFDNNWPDELRSQFETPPAQWLQQDRDGRPLPSWYGGDYNPACMNNPDWRKYERHMVRLQLEAGHDGIFFDNPTVHPQGCYCPHCMTRFRQFLREEGDEMSSEELEAARKYAADHPDQFMRFRSVTARDFLADIRQYARTIKPDALITCNNSLNSPDVLYRQSRLYGYNIAELSRAQDYVLIEDMVTQPRIEAGGQLFEYGPTYKQLHAIASGKPVVATVLAHGDYHTPPNLVRLAMAEAAAHNASYLSWPAWPQEQRQRMAETIRPQADLLRRNEGLLNDTAARADVLLFLPLRRWVQTERCVASELAAAMSTANLQYAVVSEDGFDLPVNPGRKPVFLVESRSVLTPREVEIVDGFERDGGRVVVAEKGDWLQSVGEAVGRPSVAITGPATVRVVVRDQPDRTIIHLYNLNVQRLSSFDDQVTPATGITFSLSVPAKEVRQVSALTADAQATSGDLEFVTQREGDNVRVHCELPRLDIATIIVVDHSRGQR